MLKLRDLWISDIDYLVDLEIRSFGETMGKEMLTAEAQNRNALFIVATWNDEPIGYIGAWLVDGELEILNFVIEPEHWHKGIGQKLFNKLIKDASRAGAKKAILEVRVENYRAIYFYQLQGFIKVRERKNYYQDGSDAFVMIRVLK